MSAAPALARIRAPLAAAALLWGTPAAAQLIVPGTLPPPGQAQQQTADAAGRTASTGVGDVGQRIEERGRSQTGENLLRSDTRLPTRLRSRLRTRVDRDTALEQEFLAARRRQAEAVLFGSAPADEALDSDETGAIAEPFR
ncbi:hypothetical protein EYB45_03280 [Erythrobacteraceae bacterium CFH 75059]|uniref:hypothetical protein n=1 Tax=Qipengyuania thermophila TaxID=2509361 RepID=UPI0010217445|nr:hypothetical protein [Qipengyuania thermophila]TCD06724.1 hypothetical protein EYB45_03280 [Erythrobacteraceae bacterium CFH 75059]